MNRLPVIMLAVLVIAAIGCATTKRESIETPMQLELGPPGSPLGPVTLLSGQMVALRIGCPPIELRDESGKLFRKLKYTTNPQVLEAPPGKYSIVGHDPLGREWTLNVVVTGD